MFRFLGEGLRHMPQVGTVVPSSRWMARSMTRSVRRAPSPRRVLEVGPGTGAITRALLPLLEGGDELDLVELNPAFCRHLETRLLGPFRRRRPDVAVRLHCDSILTVDLAGRYDCVICSLPFRAFPVRLVRRILARITALVADDGELTYLEYVGAGAMKSPFLPASRRRELRCIDRMLRTANDRHRGSRELVVMNILPSFVVRLAPDADRRNGAPNGAPHGVGAPNGDVATTTTRDRRPSYS